MASQDAPLLEGYDLSSITAKDEDLGKEEGAHGLRAVTEHKDGAQDKVQDTTGEAEEGLHGTMIEGDEVFVSPPIWIVPEPWHAPPPLFHPEKLELVSDLRIQLADQVHHGTLMHQCIDILYEAFSNVPKGKKCPMCPRHFSLLTWNGPHNGDPGEATSGANG
jgi:hypothetical protein